ncbi:MAG: hypothetical protein LC772_06170 [Chloroflexi bacterium]|nr:hypothetical protein [Chloroflexota bacterium]
MFIAVAPSDSRRIYTGSNQGELWMTTDGGATWAPIHTGASSLPNRCITSIVVDPHNADSILVGVSGTGTGHLWRCADTTASERTWNDLSGSGGSALPDIPLDSIAVIPGSADGAAGSGGQTGRVIYVGTDVGVFRSSDDGQTWSNATGPLGLPNVPINDLQYVPGTGYLNAVTFGRGLWRLKIEPAAVRATPSARQNNRPAPGDRSRMLAGLLSVITVCAGIYFLLTRRLNTRRPVV